MEVVERRHVDGINLGIGQQRLGAAVRPRDRVIAGDLLGPGGRTTRDRDELGAGGESHRLDHELGDDPAGADDAPAKRRGAHSYLSLDGSYSMTIPPVTFRAWPVISLASVEARNRTTFATCSGSWSRPIGIAPSQVAWISSLVSPVNVFCQTYSRSIMSVLTTPGQTQLTLTVGAISIARHFVNAITAAFDAQ